MAGKPALVRRRPSPPFEAAGARVPAGVAAVRAGSGLLARPVRLTLGGLTAALESVVEEGKLGFASARYVRPQAHPRIIIMGLPGAGKTIIAQQYAFQNGHLSRSRSSGSGATCSIPAVGAIRT